MQLLEFRDHCVITRANGGKDEWDNDIRPEEIYSGPCCYQEGGASESRVFLTRNPIVFLPSVDARIEINDTIEVETEFGREIKSIVQIVRDVNMPWRSNIKVTRIELKQSHGN